MKKETVLVVAAHPDDEVLGCGGTMARLAQDGHPVFAAILGEGMTSRAAKRDEASPAGVKALHECGTRAGAVLGVKERFQFGLPDNRFDTVALLDIVKIIEQLIDRLSPNVIYTQHGGDLNIDHAITFRAALTATRPMQGTPVTRVYAFEVPSSTEWAFHKLTPAFHPNVFVDIGSTLPLKLEAMALYESEVRSYPHPRSIRALEANALRWGSVSGLAAAEAFELVREIRPIGQGKTDGTVRIKT